MEAQMARKIKAAIKAKLIQMEAYVDDELPDYIMVMVANKKTQPQMSSDLALFLGDDANKFATWLQRVLTKIQSITAEKQKNNNNPESEDDPKKRIKEDTARDSTPPPHKKVAMSFKKKIDLKSKISGTTTPLETSPTASPRPHDSLGINAVSAPSPVSSASLNNSPAPHRSPSPGNVKDESTSSTKKRKSEEGKKTASTSTSKDVKLKKKKGAGEEEEKKREEKQRKKVKKEQQRQKDVEDKESQIVVIMEQIQRLKQKLLEEQASCSEDEEDDQQQVGDLVRAKIATLRERLENIQEELNGDEEENEEESSKEVKEEVRKESAKEGEVKEEEVKEDAKKDSGLGSLKENDAEVTKEQQLITENSVNQNDNSNDNSNDELRPDVDSNDSLGVVAMKEGVVKMPEMTNNSDIDSRCTTPLMDELPSPGVQNSNDASGDADDEMTAIKKIDEEARLTPTSQSDYQTKTPVTPTPDIFRHLPSFLSNSTDWRRCAQCGGEEKVSVVCLECKAALHCQSSSNCFRAWHLNGKLTANVPNEEDFKLDTVAMKM